jgi:hypothetical protein
MTKNLQQLVDKFFSENLGLKPESSKLGTFDHLSLDELRSLAEHGIRMRVALRSSNQIKDDLRSLLIEEDLNLYQLNEQQLKEKIDYHSKKLQIERQTI